MHHVLAPRCNRLDHPHNGSAVGLRRWRDASAAGRGRHHRRGPDVPDHSAIRQGVNRLVIVLLGVLALSAVSTPSSALAANIPGTPYPEAGPSGSLINPGYSIPLANGNY